MTNTQLLHSIWVSFTKPEVLWVGADLEDTLYVGITPFNCFSYSLHPVVADLLCWSKLRATICSEVCTNALYDINGRRWESILYIWGTITQEASQKNINNTSTYTAIHGHCMFHLQMQSMYVVHSAADAIRTDPHHSFELVRLDQYRAFLLMPGHKGSWFHLVNK